MIQFSEFVNWAFYGVVSGCAVYGVSILAKLNSSIQDLNVKIAVVIERQSGHEKRLDKHDEQIETLSKN